MKLNQVSIVTLAACFFLLAGKVVQAQQWANNGTDIYNSNTGNVGIGTTGPGFPLDVQAAAGSQQIKSTTGTNYAYLQFTNTGGNTFVGRENSVGGSFGPSDTAAYSSIFGGSGAYPMHFITNNLTRMTILSGGNVGIGTTGPGAKLEVAGDMKITGTIPIVLSGTNPIIDATGGRLTFDATDYDFRHRATAATRLYINTTSGNVGIGTTSPGALLDVNGNFVIRGTGTQQIAGDLALTSANPTFYANATNSSLNIRSSGTGPLNFQNTAGGDVNFNGGTASPLVVIKATTGNVGIGMNPLERLHVDGNVKVTGNISAKYQDIAEWVPTARSASPGTVVVLDPDRTNSVAPSNSPYDTRVAGVVSANPGIVLGEAAEGSVKVATTGRVKIRVDASRSPIHIGDLLVTSDKEGVAMRSEPVEVAGIKMHRPGTLIGKALESLERGEGEILVLLSLQ